MKALHFGDILFTNVYILDFNMMLITYLNDVENTIKWKKIEKHGKFDYSLKFLTVLTGINF
jgi:hypothetical protein